MSDHAEGDTETVGATRIPLPALWAAIVLAQIGVVISNGLGWARPAYGWFAAMGALLAAIDLYERRLPNRLLYPSAALAVMLLAAGSALDGDTRQFGWGLAVGLGYSLLLAAAGRMPGGDVGMGDVKLAFPVGLFVGYVGWGAAVVAVVGAMGLTVAAGVALTVGGRATVRDAVPFAPPMVLAAWAAIAAAELGLV